MLHIAPRDPFHVLNYFFSLIRTIDKSAVNGKDYKGTSEDKESRIEFKHGETHQLIKIPIIDDMEFEKDENFEIELYEPEGGAKLGKINRTAVTITNDDEFNSVLNRMLLMTNANVDSMKVHHETWAQQLKDAMNVNGGDVENATTVRILIDSYFKSSRSFLSGHPNKYILT